MSAGRTGRGAGQVKPHWAFRSPGRVVLWGGWLAVLVGLFLMAYFAGLAR